MVTNLFTTALAATSFLSTLTIAAPVKGFSTNILNSRQSNLKFPFFTEKVRGVNLGGWFVLEPWITPSVFANQPGNVVDEFTLTQQLGNEAATSLLENHWNTWITQDDFNQIAALGLNFVRIPIGYWSIAPIEGDPYVQGAYDVLGKALDWAQTAGLKVMIDLHGAPGSQNGFDNSGRRGGIGWGNGDTITQTKTALERIVADHAAHPAVAMVECVNEPNGNVLGMEAIQSFYTEAYQILNTNGVAVTFHDAFLTPQAFNDALLPGLPNIVMDTHHYEVFDQGQLAMSPGAHVSSACAFGAGMASDTKWTISGEWTSAQTDCAKWLNGLGVGARYDGTFNYNGVGSSYIGSCAGLDVGTVDALPPAYKTSLAQFTEAQLDAYEKAAGWIYWAWKTETAPEWHFQNLTAAGIIPQPLSKRNFPGQCA